MVEKNTVQRILLALKKFNSHGTLERDKFLEEAGISIKTFKRMLKDLRDVLELPIVYDTKNNLYFLDSSAPVKGDNENIIDMIKKLSSESELLFFYSFVKSMVESEYFFPPVNSKAKGQKVTDYNQILRFLEKLIPQEDIFVSDHIGYYMSEHYKLDRKLKFRNMIETVLTALRSRKYINFTYNDAKLRVKPVKIIYYHGKWYLFGIRKESSNAKGEEERTYNLSHITGMKLSKMSFAHLSDPEIDYKDSFGLFMDNCCSTAVIRFYSPHVIRDMKEISWSETQKTTVGKDKKKGDFVQFELEYPHSGHVELIARVLRFGRNAEIVSPKPLRNRWIEEIRAMHGAFV